MRAVSQALTGLSDGNFWSGRKYPWGLDVSALGEEDYFYSV